MAADKELADFTSTAEKDMSFEDVQNLIELLFYQGILDLDLTPGSAGRPFLKQEFRAPNHPTIFLTAAQNKKEAGPPLKV
ncbi:hypothetical protein [Halobacillus sp. Marseille-Q1614]|uniref:hypothetical protein n=1 Tax=Halobacillus sp. Marseille-Q1614 TaxID=2709134 RepID=UPI00156F0C2A|nr:hypothetical protein [Halobacillus sp. Marseille-Q1614]